MLICVDDFSNYIMVKLLKDNCASTVHTVMVWLIQREGHIPIVISCDQGSEFKNKLFDHPKTNGFQVQFMIDQRKAVYAEHAIGTIQRSLEQYFLLWPTNDLPTAVQWVVQSHNNAPSRHNPLLQDGQYASPLDVVEDLIISTKMERILHNRHLNQYSMNIEKTNTIHTEI